MRRRSEDNGRREGWDATIGTAAACVAVAAALLVGGVHPKVQIALSGAVLLLAVAAAWTRRSRGVRVVVFMPLFALFALLDLAQLIPLPASIVHVVSPGAYDLRSAVSQSQWMPLTLDVPATALALVRALAGLGMFAVVAWVCRSRRVATRVLTVLAILGAVESAIAIVERALNATAILGVYVPRSKSGMGLFGTFVNSNHAASVLTIGALVSAGLALDARGGRRVLFIACAVVAAATTVATGSRGGVLGLAAGGFLVVAVSLIRSRGAMQGAVMATVLLAIGAALALWSNDALRARMLPTSPAQLVENQKTRGWIDGLRMARDYRWSGVGRGAFEAPLRAYRADDEEVRLVYPENFLVQSSAEWGLPVTALLLVLAALAFRKIARCEEVWEPPLLGALAAVVAAVVHELMDFGTEFPGVALPATVALAVLVGVSVRRDESSRRMRRSQWVPCIGAWVVALLFAGAASAHTLDADDVASHDGVVERRATESELAAAISRHPADDYLELLAAEDAMHRRDAKAMHHVNRALLLHPASWRAHQLAAHLLAALGRRSQAAIEYGLAERHGFLVDDRQLFALLGDDVVETVPQHPAELLALAQRMIAIGHRSAAQKAWVRALDLADPREPVLAAEVRAATVSRDATLIVPMAKALLREATTSDSFLAAAEALAGPGTVAQASEAIDLGLRAHPHDPQLLLEGARVKLSAGHADAARALLTADEQRDFTLEQRRDAQQVLADIAEHAGDVEGAVVARARAQLLERQIRAIRSDSSNSGRK
jgi:hypothetical protein